MGIYREITSNYYSILRIYREFIEILLGIHLNSQFGTSLIKYDPLKFLEKSIKRIYGILRSFLCTLQKKIKQFMIINLIKYSIWSFRRNRPD